MDIASYRNATLSMNSIILPGGEHRRRNDEDALQMRSIFVENDLISVGFVVHGYCRLKFSRLINLALYLFTHDLQNMEKYLSVFELSFS